MEAVQFTGHNDAECIAFCPGAKREDKGVALTIPAGRRSLTLLGSDWIFKNAKGEFSKQSAPMMHKHYEQIAVAGEKMRYFFFYYQYPLGSTGSWGYGNCALHIEGFPNYKIVQELTTNTLRGQGNTLGPNDVIICSWQELNESDFKTFTAQTK